MARPKQGIAYFASCSDHAPVREPRENEILEEHLTDKIDIVTEALAGEGCYRSEKECHARKDFLASRGITTKSAKLWTQDGLVRKIGRRRKNCQTNCYSIQRQQMATIPPNLFSIKLRSTEKQSWNLPAMDRSGRCFFQKKGCKG